MEDKIFDEFIKICNSIKGFDKNSKNKIQYCIDYFKENLAKAKDLESYIKWSNYFTFIIDNQAHIIECLNKNENSDLFCEKECNDFLSLEESNNNYYFSYFDKSILCNSSKETAYLVDCTRKKIIIKRFTLTFLYNEPIRVLVKYLDRELGTIRLDGYKIVLEGNMGVEIILDEGFLEVYDSRYLEKNEPDVAHALGVIEWCINKKTKSPVSKLQIFDESMRDALLVFAMIPLILFNEGTLKNEEFIVPKY